MYGGAEKLLVNFTKFHVENQEVEIIYLKGEPLLIKQLDPNIKVTKISLGWDVLIRLNRHLRNSKPDVIHTHLGHADFIGLLGSYWDKYKKSMYNA